MGKHINDPFTKHELRIALDTLMYPAKALLGGPSSFEALQSVERILGWRLVKYYDSEYAFRTDELIVKVSRIHHPNASPVLSYSGRINKKDLKTAVRCLCGQMGIDWTIFPQAM